MASVGVSLFSTRPPLTWEFAALTDVGRTRAHNEDAVHVDSALGLALLADGMGGYKGGEVASAMAVSLMHASFGRWFAQAGMQAPTRVIRSRLSCTHSDLWTSVGCIVRNFSSFQQRCDKGCCRMSEAVSIARSGTLPAGVLKGADGFGFKAHGAPTYLDLRPP